MSNVFADAVVPDTFVHTLDIEPSLVSVQMSIPNHPLATCDQIGNGKLIIFRTQPLQWGLGEKLNTIDNQTCYVRMLQFDPQTQNVFEVTPRPEPREIHLNSIICHSFELKGPDNCKLGKIALRKVQQFFEIPDSDE